RTGNSCPAKCDSEFGLCSCNCCARLATIAAPLKQRRGAMNEKIKNHHLTRKAILYVRQSSTYQVVYNEESRRLQYAMRERLEQLGWEQIEVIDEDLGRSAAG